LVLSARHSNRCKYFFIGCKLENVSKIYDMNTFFVMIFHRSRS